MITPNKFIPICCFVLIVVVCIQSVLLYKKTHVTSKANEPLQSISNESKIVRNKEVPVDPANCFLFEKKETTFATYTFISIGGDLENNEGMPEYCLGYTLFVPERRVIATSKKDDRMDELLNERYNNAYALPYFHSEIRNIDCQGSCNNMDFLYTVSQEAGHYFPMEKVYRLKHAFGVPYDSYSSFNAATTVRTENSGYPAVVFVSFWSNYQKKIDFEIRPVYEPICEQGILTIKQLQFVGVDFDTTHPLMQPIDVPCVEKVKGPFDEEDTSITYVPSSPNIDFLSYDKLALTYASTTVGVVLDEEPYVVQTLSFDAEQLKKNGDKLSEVMFGN